MVNSPDEAPQEGLGDWAAQFKIHPHVELNFIIGTRGTLPVAMGRNSPAEFKRRIAAASISYALGLTSVDYTRRKYLPANLYEEVDQCLGDEVSSYIAGCIDRLAGIMAQQRSEVLESMGEFGSRFTFSRLPSTIDAGRVFADRGYLLELIPVLRLTLEMIAWAVTADEVIEEDKVRVLQASACISNLKRTYSTAGYIYGYLSKFNHWNHRTHHHFLCPTLNRLGVLIASPKFRAVALVLILLIMDVWFFSLMRLKEPDIHNLILELQKDRVDSVRRTTLVYAQSIAQTCQLEEIYQILTFFEDA